ncbi:putative GATA transcription factor 22 [Juglans microcarpa x Juglans regia]|uniref:putative GATA transcription factor 22 n=1 Tax=Juglans microcarpa x Juglans regia TaxID=2249226 RepID=UPI001B7DA6F5|nr:putative GATA transcription factor 22 [Juglans microcarpa x Juglans regia]
MTPAYLNLPSSLCPLAEQREEDQHLKLFIPSNYQASSSLSCHTFFDGNRDERGISVFEGSQQHDHHEKAHQFIGSSSRDHPQAFPFPSFQSTVDQEDSKNPDKLSLSCQRDQEAGRDHGSKNAVINGPVQWMSSKMRFMQKMVDPNFPATNRPVRSTKKLQNNQQQQHGIFEMSSSVLHNSNNVNAAARVCADCSTTTTPLWRSGPRGPKSLCNACGIRQRKARRAIAEASAAAANHGLVVATDNNISSSVKSSSSSTNSTTKVQNKEKKLRTSCHFAQYKNKYCKLRTTDDSNIFHDHDDHNIIIERPTSKQLSFKDFALSLRNNPAFERVFPKDETEAAILLMELSCGLVHS